MASMAPTRPDRPPRPGGPLAPVRRRQWCLALRADLTAAAAARRVVTSAIRTWRLPCDSDVAVLLASELVSNAVTHGRPAVGACVLLTVAGDATGLRVEVQDGSADLPVGGAPGPGATGPGATAPAAVPSEAGAETETGRGLLLVATLAAEWGFYRTRAGKAVYFTLDFPGGPGELPGPLGCSAAAAPGAGDGGLFVPVGGPATGETGRTG